MLKAYQKTYQDFGLKALVIEISNTLLSRIGVTKIERVYTLECQQFDLPPNEGIEIKSLNYNELEALRASRQFNFSSADSARINNNEALCYAAYANNEVIGIDWIALKPYQHGGATKACFKSQWACEYGLWLHPNARGKGVRKLFLNAAMPAIKKYGKKGLVIGVFWNNFASLRSSEKLGYQYKGKSYWIEQFQKGIKPNKDTDYWLIKS